MFTQKYKKSFLSDEAGAVTVDWVVLTAAIVGIGIAVITVVAQGISNAADGINTELNEAAAVTLPVAT